MVSVLRNATILAVAGAMAGVGGATANGATSVANEAALPGAGQVPAATRVAGSRIVIKVSGKRFRKRATLVIRGVRGRAKGVSRTVKVRKRVTVRNLKPGKYRIRGVKITKGSRVARATAMPKHVWVSEQRGASARVRYRLIKKPVLRPETISAGMDHTCALATDGKAWCWGSNSAGQLGAGSRYRSRSRSHVAVAVEGGRQFTSVSAGAVYTCALDTDGKAWCWGNDYFGQLGNGRRKKADKHRPTAVKRDLTFVAIAAGDSHACAVERTGQAWCWGADSAGRLGDGIKNGRTKHSPIKVAGEHRFVVIAAGGVHTCALDRTGKAWCWGDDQFGQVGDGKESSKPKYTPAAVAGGRSFGQIAAGSQHSCALQVGGKAWCWGRDTAGVLGNGYDPVRWLGGGVGGTGAFLVATRHSPSAVAGDRTYTAIAAGDSHTCALSATNGAFCWGYGFYRQIGDGGDRSNKHVPVAVVGGSAFAAITAGERHSCAVDRDHKAFCWGSDEYGKLGNGPGRSNSSRPVQVAEGHSYLTP